jgi:hypothetical protein
MVLVETRQGLHYPYEAPFLRVETIHRVRRKMRLGHAPADLGEIFSHSFRTILPECDHVAMSTPVPVVKASNNHGLTQPNLHTYLQMGRSGGQYRPSEQHNTLARIPDRI